MNYDNTHIIILQNISPVFLFSLSFSASQYFISNTITMLLAVIAIALREHRTAKYINLTEERNIIQTSL